VPNLWHTGFPAGQRSQRQERGLLFPLLPFRQDQIQEANGSALHFPALGFRAGKVRELSRQVVRRLYELDPEADEIVSGFFTRRVLALLAEAAQEPSIAYATVYAHSQISDYLMCCWVNDQEEGHKILSALKNKLGISVHSTDRITDLSRKIRN
jgi:hypothetical protein